MIGLVKDGNGRKRKELVGTIVGREIVHANVAPIRFQTHLNETFLHTLTNPSGGLLIR
jgi:hypothetical protein